MKMKVMTFNCSIIATDTCMLSLGHPGQTQDVAFIERFLGIRRSCFKIVLNGMHSLITILRFYINTMHRFYTGITKTLSSRRSAASRISSFKGNERAL